MEVLRVRALNTLDSAWISKFSMDLKVADVVRAFR
jgi:hypothetical protein